MSATELRDLMNRMDAKAKADFRRKISVSDGWDDERIIEMFVKEPAWEKNICHVLGVLTQSDKVGLANIESAQYARKGFVISLWAFVIALASAVLSLIALLK